MDRAISSAAPCVGGGHHDGGDRCGDQRRSELRDLLSGTEHVLPPVVLDRLVRSSRPLDTEVAKRRLCPGKAAPKAVLSLCRGGASVGGLMEFRILGPLEVVEDGHVLDVGGAKQRALLAFLLLHANEVVSTDRLIEALWEDDPPETAQKALQVYVSQLRKLLGKERLETRAPGYCLRVADGELDLSHFQRVQEEGHLHEALALWRGPPLAEFGDQRFAQA